MDARGAGSRRAFVSAAALASAGALGGCSWMPWVSKKPKPPELPPQPPRVPARVAWSHLMRGAGAGFQPALTQQGVWSAGRDGAVLRIDPASGRIESRFSAGRPLMTAIGTDGSTIAAGARDGSLLAFDTEGKQRWSVPAGAEIVSVPSVALGLVIVRASDNRVSAFEADTGRRRWSFQRQSPPLVLRQTSAIAMDPSSAYVGLPGGRMAALSLANGSLRWEAVVAVPRGSNEIERIADVVGSPLVGGREVCAATFQGRVACFDTATGRQTWSRDVSSSGGLDIDASMLAVSDDKGQVLAYSRSGASLWRQDAIRQRRLSAPLIKGGRVLVGDENGFVHLLSRDDGAYLGRVSTDGSPIAAAPLDAGPVAVVQTTAGAVFGIVVE